jgi:hypothetical protein
MEVDEGMRKNFLQFEPAPRRGEPEVRRAGRLRTLPPGRCDAGHMCRVLPLILVWWCLLVLARQGGLEQAGQERLCAAAATLQCLARAATRGRACGRSPALLLCCVQRKEGWNALSQRVGLAFRALYSNAVPRQVTRRTPDYFL